MAAQPSAPLLAKLPGPLSASKCDGGPDIKFHGWAMLGPVPLHFMKFDGVPAFPWPSPRDQSRPSNLMAAQPSDLHGPSPWEHREEPGD